MKRVLLDSDDWRTNTDDSEINGFREIMASNLDYVGEPYVGIFWYDVDKQELFGVYSVIAQDENFQSCSVFNQKVKTCKRLHYQVWSKGQHSHRDHRFQQKYIDVPRGRVFQLEDGHFVVCLGSWFNNHLEAKELILDEFDLPDDTEFKVDVHWEVGHGWSDKML